MRGRRNDEFARQRQERAFQGHQQNDDRVATGFERAQIPGEQRLKEFVHLKSYLRACRNFSQPSLFLYRATLSIFGCHLTLFQLTNLPPNRSASSRSQKSATTFDGTK